MNLKDKLKKGAARGNGGGKAWSTFVGGELPVLVVDELASPPGTGNRTV